MKKINKIAKPVDMKAWDKRITANRIKMNACKHYLKLMQDGKPMRCANPKAIAKQIYYYTGVACNYNKYSVWISDFQYELF